MFGESNRKIVKNGMEMLVRMRHKGAWGWKANLEMEQGSQLFYLNNFIRKQH